ncbi:MAG TPA: cytochrome c oxidase subunit II [Steroidobacteraceae bacterium]|nr:cytochrome c oxidase subunit II [Steroidobacteraceae bacterium]
MSHAALQPAGPFAAHIAQVFWEFVAVAVVVYVVVAGFLVYALRRRRALASADVSNPPSTHAALRAISIAVALTTAILIGLALSDFLAGRALAAVPANALQVRVTAHQWWWDIEYLDSNPSRRLRTANELVIPVDRPVTLQLQSADVIHSFWVPSLQGKKDLLPGYTTTLNLRASRPGLYTGECAEFCGFQHAHMSVDVEARPRENFAQWLEAQLAPGAQPRTETQARGREVFLKSTCVMCHAIAGTDAAAALGPDLTHVGSRRRIAAGTLPNTPSNLAAWIADPQSIKPGTRMPPTVLTPVDATALVAYLANLQ